MTDKEHNPDPNENAARIVAESTAGDNSLPADEEEESRLGERISDYLPADSKKRDSK